MVVCKEWIVVRWGWLGQVKIVYTVVLGDSLGNKGMVSFYPFEV